MYQSLTPNLMVENVEKSIGFYEENLGFSLVTSVPSLEGGLQFAILVKDAITIMFQSKESLLKEYEILSTSVITPSLTLFIKVSNVEELYHELCEKVTILKPLHETFYQTKEFAILDLNNNVLTISES